MIVVEVWAFGILVVAIVGGRGEIGLGMDLREGPGFAAVVSEGEVGAILVGMFVVAAGNDAVERVAKGDGKDSGGSGAVDDGSVEDLPGLAVVGGVEDAGDCAASGEPEVGVRGGSPIFFWGRMRR